MNIRTVVKIHLHRERLDVLLAVLAPLVLMLASSWSNAWAFAGGNLDLRQANTYGALLRGLFLEALIYTCFKLVKLFFTRPNWKVRFVGLVPALVGVVGMIVSAGCSLGWAMQSGEMASIFAIVSQYMPAQMSNVFKLGVGLLFPVAVGVLAMVDPSHLVEDVLRSAHLDNRALQVHRAEMHRTGFLKAQRRAVKKAQQQYNEICETDAQRMVAQVRNGDLSFGAKELEQVAAHASMKRLPAQPTQVIPVPNAPLSLPTPARGMTGPAAPAPLPASGFAPGAVPKAMYPPMPSVPPMPPTQS